MFELNYKTKKMNPFFIKAYFKAKFAPSPAQEKVPGHLTLKEVIALKDTVKAFAQGGTIVEIGSFLGKSSNCLAEAMGGNGHLYCVDTWENDAMPGGRIDNYQEFLQNMKKWETIYTPLRGKSSNIVKTWNIPIDYLWIDGDHSYKGCGEDIRNWFPFLKLNGWICLHDYLNPCGVEQAAQELLQGKIDKYFFVDSIFFGRKCSEL